MSFLDELAFGPGRSFKAWLRVLLLLAAAVAMAGVALYFTVANDYSFLDAAIYTGAKGGEYNAVGERLAARAGRQRGRLHVIETAGSIENIERLAGKNERCEPGFAFVQDGLPLPMGAGLSTLGRLPQPESLLLLARRGRALASFDDLKDASIGIGPEGSGTAYLMQHLLENSDLKDLHIKAQNFDLEAQAARVAAGTLDLAAFVMNENAALIRDLIERNDLDLVALSGIEGLTTRDRWLHVGRIPSGYYDVARQIPSSDRIVPQVDTLVVTNACVGRAERVAFLRLLGDEFPSFVRDNPPPSAQSQDPAPLADEAREFFANGQPALPDRYFPRLVNLMSPAYWIYLAMAVTIVFNATEIYSRFRLWRIDANREALETRLKALSTPPIVGEHIRTLPADAVLEARNRSAAEALMKALQDLRARCQAQLKSYATPMGREMYYRYQESLIEEAIAALSTLMSRERAG